VPTLAAEPTLRGWTRWDAGDEQDDALARLFAEPKAAIEAVVHLAGQSSAARSFEDPVGTLRINAGGTLRLLEAARHAKFGGPLLVVGSSEAYGRIPQGVPCSEETPLVPVSPYGVSKAAADHATRVHAAAFGLKALVARSFSHTGPGQAPVFAVASWARQIAAFEADGAGSHRLKVGNLAPVRDYGDVRDVVRAYVALLEKGEAGAAYNVATGHGTTLRAIVDALVARARVGIEVTEEAARLRPNDVPYLVGSPARLTAATGWTPEYTLEQTLSDLLDAARSAHGAPVEGGA